MRKFRMLNTLQAFELEKELSREAKEARALANKFKDQTSPWIAAARRCVFGRTRRMTLPRLPPLKIFPLHESNHSLEMPKSQDLICLTIGPPLRYIVHVV